MGWIRRATAVAGFGTVHIGDGGGVWRPGKTGDVLRVVLVVVRKFTGRDVCAADEKIVTAFRVFDPGEKRACRGGGQGRCIRSAENLLQREGLLSFRGEGGDGEKG